MPEDTVKVEMDVRGRRIRSNGVTIEPGETEEIGASAASLLAETYPMLRIVDGVEPEADDTEEFLDDWFDVGYSDRAEAIEDGLVDEHLDAIEDETQSQNELDAIERRREELSDSGDE